MNISINERELLKEALNLLAYHRAQKFGADSDEVIEIQLLKERL